VGYAAARNAAAVLEVAATLFTAGNWEPPLTRYTVGVLAKNQTLDISAARLHLGYQPKIGVAEGLRLFGNWWKEINHAT
jgi:nucleoside-diphosphate-sugar epimerase